MEALGISITVLLVLFFFKKICYELKLICNKPSRYSSLTIIIIFSICFLGLDFGHYLYHNCASNHKTIIKITSNTENNTAFSNNESILINKSRCPYCGIILKLATTPSKTNLIILHVNLGLKAPFYGENLKNLKIFTTSRAPPIS